MSAPSEKAVIRLSVNGRAVEREVPARQLLADFLRDDLGLTATRLGCEHGVCGSCTVDLDGASVRSCLMLAIQADGAELRTVEGLADGEKMHPLQQAFWDHHALQCGFCTSGFLMTALDLYEHTAAKSAGCSVGDDGRSQRERSGTSAPSERDVRHALSGNLCRCTGYSNIVEAVVRALKAKP